jgi:hypothetical protein
MAAVAHGCVGQVTSKGDPIGLGWALYYLAFAALMLLAGCLPCTVAGASRCVQNSVMVCSGSQYEEALDCSATVPATQCAQHSPDAGAYCSSIHP